MLIEKRLGGKPCTLKVVIETNQPEKLWIKFTDADQNHTFYTKRYTNIDGRQDFYIRMPQAPDIGFLLVYNNDNPQGKGEDASTFKVLETQVLPLQREKIRFNDKTESFIKFAQEFCERAGVLSCSPKGDIYKSDDLQFRIDYFDVIRNEVGKPLPTPARISKDNGRIEVSKFHFKSAFEIKEFRDIITAISTNNISPNIEDIINSEMKRLSIIKIFDKLIHQGLELENFINEIENNNE
jgi:hypothetical protein